MSVSSVDRSIRNCEMPFGHFLPDVLVRVDDGRLVAFRVVSRRCHLEFLDTDPHLGGILDGPCSQTPHASAALEVGHGDDAIHARVPGTDSERWGKSDVGVVKDQAFTYNVRIGMWEWDGIP